MVLAYVVRLLVEERRRRRVRKPSAIILPRGLVDRLTEHEAELRLGGEREVTVMFADLSGFTALSGRLAPEELMELTNLYLGLVVEAVETTGGYVDKFIGDAVMALWGAPLPDPDHAASAARGALRALAGVMRAKAEADRRGEPSYAIKIALNTGPAVIGNVGAAKRYNYGNRRDRECRRPARKRARGLRVRHRRRSGHGGGHRRPLCALRARLDKGEGQGRRFFGLPADRRAKYRRIRPNAPTRTLSRRRWNAIVLATLPLPRNSGDASPSSDRHGGAAQIAGIESWPIAAPTSRRRLQRTGTASSSRQRSSTTWR